MTEEEKFMEELLQEAEQNEGKQTEAHFDLLLLQIGQLQQQINYNFAEAEKEVEVIKQWALNKNHALQVRIDWIEKKLEAFIKEKGLKTIDLAHGVLKYHKKPDKVEISDVDLFLKNAKPEMLSVVPESVKPDMNKIKAYLKGHKAPPGVVVVSGKEEFTYKLNNGKDNADGGQEETGYTAEPAYENRAAV